MSDVKKSMTVVDKIVKALNKASVDNNKSLITMNTAVGTLATTLEELLTNIEFSTGELAGIKDNHSNKLREAVAELKLKTLENEDKVLSGLMKARDLANITEVDLEDLQDVVTDAKKDHEDTIAAAVDTARASDAMSYKMKDIATKSDNAVVVAKLEADRDALYSKVTHLELTITNLNITITAEREARVTMSGNSQASVVNVAVPK